MRVKKRSKIIPEATNFTRWVGRVVFILNYGDLISGEKRTVGYKGAEGWGERGDGVPNGINELADPVGGVFGICYKKV